MPANKNYGVFYLGLFLAGWVFFLLMAGGAVTSHEAGLAVPDWPLSYGQWFPPMVGNIFWEHGHRMIAGVAAILTLVTAVVIQIKEDRPWLKRLAWAAVGTVVLQALLGGLTVLLLLPPAVSIAHACLGQTFFCLVLAIAYFLSPASEAESGEANPRLQRFVIMTTGLIYIQLILGALLRHTGHNHALITHIVFALAVAAHVLIAAIRIAVFKKDNRNFKVPAVLWGILLIVQIFLGIGAFAFTKLVARSGPSPEMGEIIFTVAHQSMGALILGLGVLLSLMLSKAPSRAGGLS